MVIRGNTRGNGVQLAGYLLKKADNDNVRVFDIRGTSQSDDLRASLLEMSLTAELTRSDKGLYHAQINPAYGEDKKMQAAHWFKAADILEAALNLTDQKRVIVLHEKKGRIHAHVVWERYDHEKEKMISDSHSRLAQDRARKTMERELEQQQTPHRNVKRPEMKQTLSELWQKTVTGKEFIKEALQKGYIVAKGQLKRPFMVVDDTGRSFDLVRQLTGIKTKEVRERLHSEELPTEKNAIEQARQQKAQVIDPMVHLKEREVRMSKIVDQHKVLSEEQSKQKQKELLLQQLRDQHERQLARSKEISR